MLSISFEYISMQTTTCSKIYHLILSTTTSIMLRMILE